VATLEELRERSGTLFAELLKAQAGARPRRRRATRGLAPDARERDFSWFDVDDAVAAAAMSFRLAALAASGETVEDGLGAALDHAEEEGRTARAEEVQIGLALFVTHNHAGRRLAKPRTVAAAPELFTPPRVRGDAPAVSIGGVSPGLDYWREDVLANEHHQHWHEVYPFVGLPPRSFSDWLTDHTTDDLVAILEALDPSQPWRDLVPTLEPAQLASIFSQVVSPGVARALPRELYGKLFHLNDRQGELFFYMHAQMLARYDAELLSHGLPRVEPFGPDHWDDPIAAGHDPIELEGFGRREAGERLPPEDETALRSLWDAIDDALEQKRLLALGGGTVPIDRTNLGEAVEPAVPQLRALAEDAYPGLHGSGHVAISRLGAPVLGVMRSTVTAIRDPVFWQWHKAIDDLNARWQQDLDPYPFDDAPPVLLRNALDPNADTPWASPDIILCRTSDLPEGEDPVELGTRLFGGANWDRDFAAAQASEGAASLETIDALTTTMATVNFGGARRRFLTHEPHSYFIRIENTAPEPVGVTVRIFLVPADQDADRRSWMEMDKFLVDLAPGKQVVYRPDTESSVVKRPAETSPAAVIEGDGDPDERAYCDCGWPYTLLLPRGRPEGMPVRLLALCTDAAIDRVEHPEHCGSMSYCGAVDRYPDTRDMGYPFCRPFEGPPETAIRDRIVALNSAAARTATIRHVP
jgi:hypothetical protein